MGNEWMNKYALGDLGWKKWTMEWMVSGHAPGKEAAKFVQRNSLKAANTWIYCVHLLWGEETGWPRRNPVGLSDGILLTMERKPWEMRVCCQLTLNLMYALPSGRGTRNEIRNVTRRNSGFGWFWKDPSFWRIGDLWKLAKNAKIDLTSYIIR